MGLLDSLESSVSNDISNVTSTGVPAVIAGVEAYGASQLTQAASQSQAQATAAAVQIAATSTPSTGIMASIEGMFGNVAKSTVITQYGPYILAGIAGIVVLVFILRK